MNLNEDTIKSQEQLPNIVFIQFFLHSMKTRNGKFRFDFTSEHTIYEIKNYMYESTGTADEKLLYDAYKYIPTLNEKYKNIIIVLCAKMETLDLTKYYSLFQSLGLLDDLINHGVYIILMSDLIHDFISIIK